MKFKSYKIIKRALPGVLFGFSIVLISLAVHINPSLAPPGSPFGSSSFFYIFTIISFVISSGIFILPLLWVQKKYFFLIFSLSFIFQLGLLVLCSVFIHRDYYTMVFQLFIMYPLIFFFQYKINFTGSQESIHVRRMYTMSAIFFVLWFIWLMLMGYAIATRQEPRWMESIIYNVYISVLILMLFIHMLKFRSRMYRRVFITSNTIRIDNYDFTEYLGKVNLNIIQTFILNHNKNVTCSLLISCLSDVSQNSTSSNKWDCEECLNSESKVTLCPRYKTIYNRILDIKKLFESLEIGTIISPDNKMNILTEGWKLRFFDDIRVFDKE